MEDSPEVVIEEETVIEDTETVSEEELGSEEEEEETGGGVGGEAGAAAVEAAATGGGGGEEYEVEEEEEEEGGGAQGGPLEAVSDEELPAPPRAEDVPDAEAISEDELPRAEQTSPLSDGSVAGEEDVTGEETEGGEGAGSGESGGGVSGAGEGEEEDAAQGDEGRAREEEVVQLPVEKKKRKSSKKSGGGPPSKKQAVDLGKPQTEIKSLPELEKYWKAVKDDSTDFTGWTYLLQYVDQENDVDAAREAYDAFLSHYPYCYGYWRKYADYERRKGDKTKCEEVFERGLKAIPLSVDLWIHYINYCKTVYKSDEDHMRQQFQRAIDVCGIEFRSDRLWESYIKWEVEGKNFQQAMAVYEKLLTTPLQTYTTHFENFEEFVRNHQPNKILGVDEFLTLRQEVLQEMKQKSKAPAVGALGSSAAPPGDDEEEEAEKSPKSADEETKMVREKIIASRKEVFKATVSAVSARWNYEEGIKRPYFHVKPLERYQLNNWMNYLDFEIESGDEKRTMTLFERCLIACALYDEFWFKYIRYLESLGGDRIEKIRDVYRRACTIHHPNKPFLALNWAVFEEVQGNIEGGREALERIDKEVPGLMKVAMRRINLERRTGNLQESVRLYEKYIAEAKSKAVATALAVKYARFCWKILEDPNKGIEILRKAAENDRENPRVELQMLDLTLAKPGIQEEEFVSIVDKLIESPNIEPEFKLSFAQRKVEFLEDFGKDASRSMKASHEYMNILKLCKDRKRKRMEPEKAKPEESSSKKSKEVSSNHQVPSKTTSSSASQINSSSGYGQTGSYSTGGQTGYQGSSSYPQQSYGQSSYNQTDQNYNNYQGWGYGQGYGNYNQAWSGYNYYSS